MFSLLLLLLLLNKSHQTGIPGRPLTGKNAKSLSSSSSTSTGMRRDPFVEVGSRPERCSVPRTHQCPQHRGPRKVGGWSWGQILLLIAMQMHSSTISSYSPRDNGPSAFRNLKFYCLFANSP